MDLIAVTHTEFSLMPVWLVSFAYSQVKVDDVGVAMGDSLVVSAENRPLIALSQGFVMAMTETSVTLLLDR